MWATYFKVAKLRSWPLARIWTREYVSHVSLMMLVLNVPRDLRDEGYQEPCGAGSAGVRFLDGRHVRQRTMDQLNEDQTHFTYHLTIPIGTFFCI